MFVSYRDDSVRLTGRWDTSNENCAVTTATGSYIEFAFEGKMALACFDVEGNSYPRLHLWIQLDGGDMIEAPIDVCIRICAKNEGHHICRIIYKGGVEVHRRWSAPLRGKVSFRGVDTEKPTAIAADRRKIIEFVGDSITEGVLIDVGYTCGAIPSVEPESLERVYQDDVCATYAWLTAEALDLRPVFMGYGAVGVTRGGHGNVPAAPVAYPYNFEGSPITHKADVVMINHGANDSNKTPEEYTKCYGELIDEVRKNAPDATVIALSAFCGAFHKDLGEFVEVYNSEHRCDVKFIDTFGWIPKDPLHPLRDGHRTVSENLIPLLKNIIK